MARPLFLIANDDGVHAPGLAVLRRVASLFGETWVVAPHMERSGSGQALTLTEPLRLQQLSDRVFTLTGTPADCVMFGINEILPRKPDWVFSGINRGSNLGQDTLYSGTVAAAMEACLQGVSAMAFSLKGAMHFTENDFADAGRVVELFLTHLARFKAISEGAILNVNIPNTAYTSMKSVRATPLGRRLYDTRFVKNQDPRGYDYYWLAGGGDEFADIPESDCVLLHAGHITLSILKPDHVDQKKHEHAEKECLSILNSTFANQTGGT